MKEKGRGGKGGRGKGRRKGREGERDLAPPPRNKKSWRRHCDPGVLKM